MASFATLISLDCVVAYGQETVVTATIALGKVSVSQINTNAAVISWVTIMDSTSELRYDAAAHTTFEEYAQATTVDSSLVSQHSIALSGLAPAHTYHFRVRSIAEDVVVVSEDYSFTTSSGVAGGGAGGGGMGGAGTGAGIPAGPGVTNLLPYINASGLFNIPATASSADGKARLEIEKGVQAQTQDGGPLKSVSILPVEHDIGLPENVAIIGSAYEVGPKGAKFEPAIELVIEYDPELLPKGTNESGMRIAAWDSETSEWVELECTVDTMMRSVSVMVDQLSRFAIFAHVMPAQFSVSELSVSPANPKPSQPVSITFKVKNDGDLHDSYSVVLKVNGVIETNEEVDVAGGGSTTVTLMTARDAGGTYEVDVNGLRGSFTILDLTLITPAEFSLSDLSVIPANPESSEDLSVSVIVTNSGQSTGRYEAQLAIDGAVVHTKSVNLAPGAVVTLKFDVPAQAPGTHQLRIGDLKNDLQVRAPEIQPKEAKNWWLIGLVTVAAIMLALNVALAVFRHKNRHLLD